MVVMLRCAYFTARALMPSISNIGELRRTTAIPVGYLKARPSTVFSGFQESLVLLNFLRRKPTQLE